jgi:MFS family permease
MKYLLLISSLINCLLFISGFSIQIAGWGYFIRDVIQPLFLVFIIINLILFISFFIYQKIFLQKIYKKDYSIKKASKYIYAEFSKSTKTQLFLSLGIITFFLILFIFFINPDGYYNPPLMQAGIVYTYILFILLGIDSVIFSLFLDERLFQKTTWKRVLGMGFMFLFVASYFYFFVLDPTPSYNKLFSWSFQILSVSFAGYMFFMYWWLLDWIERK